jgi:hypothetical protein
MLVFCYCTGDFDSAPLYHQKKNITQLNKNYTSICSWDYKLLSGKSSRFNEVGRLTDFSKRFFSLRAYDICSWDYNLLSGKSSRCFSRYWDDC